MNRYRVFASIYEEIETIYRMRDRDFALDTTAVSKVKIIQAETPHEAMRMYADTPEFDVFFSGRRTIFAFGIDDDNFFIPAGGRG